MSVATETPARTGNRVAAILVSLALAGNNAASYVLSLAAARILAPGAFGELSSLLAVLVIGVVPAMGLQTVVALRVARSSSSPSGSLLALGLVTSGIVATAALTLSPLLVLLLHLGSLTPALLVTAALGPLTLLGLFHGLLQGSHRFAALAGLIALEGVGKVGGSVVGLVVSRSPTGALAGAAFGSLAVVVAGWQICGRPRPRWAERHGGEVLHTAQAMLALVLLVNLDLVLARHTLPSSVAGEYALGAIVTKIAYWLPQAVGVLVLPRFAASSGRRRALPVALAVCACLDALVLLVSLVLGPALVVIGGSRYAGSTMPVWPFAVAGSMLALVQILLYARLAAGDRRVTVLMWAAVVVEAGLITGWLHASAAQVVTVAACCAGGLAVAGAILELRARRTG